MIPTIFDKKGNLELCGWGGGGVLDHTLNVPYRCYL